MPGFIARKLCPELIFVPVDFEKYNHCSSLTRKVFQRYDPDFIAASLDEAYLDITEVCRERDLSSDEVAEELRRSVFEETGLTCSAGVAPNRLLAKVCSDINKPNGQFVLPNDRMAVMTFISSLPIRKVGGIGKVTEHILRDVFGINTCEEMLQKGGCFCALFSRSSADFFLSVGLGLGRTDASQVRVRKSMSNERTFSATEDEALLYQKLAELAEMLATDLKKEGLRGRTLTLKLKTASFEVRTRAVTLQRHICSREDILLHARKLLKAELPSSLRLMGLRVSQFNEEKATALDPTQKSITNFVVLGEFSRNNICSSDSLGLNVKGNSVENSNGGDGNSEQNPDYVRKDVFDSDELSDFSFSNCSINENATIIEHSPLSNIPAEVAAARVPGHTSNLGEPDACQLVERQEPDEANRHSNSQRDGEPSSCHLDEFHWIDGYKCSICGIELPPDFVDERQEHSDFHLAERLQKEGPRSSITNHFAKQRHRETCQVAGQSSHKKHKSLAEQGKYFRIDKFFTKGSQNI